MPSSQPQTLTFNFHNLVGVRVESDDPFTVDFFRSEYLLHQVENISADLPLVELHISRGSGAVIPDYSSYAHKILARWVYHIEINHHKIVIHARGNRFAVPMIHHMLVHPSLRYLTSFQSAVLLHAAAVTHAGRSLLLVGRGGAGKTTTASMLLMRGGQDWGLHADDYVFVNTAGESLAYLTRAHLYRSLTAVLPQLRNRLTRTERLAMEILGRIRQWSRERLKWPVRVPLTRLWLHHPITMRAQSAGLLLLNSANVANTELKPLDANAHLVDELVENNFHEARHFLHLIRAERTESEWHILQSDWQARERSLLADCLDRIPAYELTIPQYHRPGSQDLFAMLAPLMEVKHVS